MTNNDSYNRMIDEMLEILLKDLSASGGGHWYQNPGSSSVALSSTSSSGSSRTAPLVTQVSNKWDRKKAAAIPRLYCAFCRKNGETRQLYSSHVLKDKSGIVVCPVLRRYTCPICGQSGGDSAHTKRFCPQNPDRDARHGRPMAEILSERPNSCGKFGRSS